jgi:hypothetical protein
VLWASFTFLRIEIPTQVHAIVILDRIAPIEPAQREVTYRLLMYEPIGPTAQHPLLALPHASLLPARSRWGYGVLRE